MRLLYIYMLYIFKIIHNIFIFIFFKVLNIILINIMIYSNKQL